MRKQRPAPPHCGALNDPRVSDLGERSAEDARAGRIGDSVSADLRSVPEIDARPAAGSFKGVAALAAHESTIVPSPRQSRPPNRDLRLTRNLVRHSNNNSSNNSQGNRVVTRDAGAFVAAAAAAAVREARAGRPLPRRPPRVK